MSQNIVTAFEVSKSLAKGLSQVIKGREDTIKYVVAGLLANGHVLLEDYPGSGKTTLCKTLGRLIDFGINSSLTSFRRVQFTPDLMPGDILGTMVFDSTSSTFSFRAGPIFAHIILADELNRAGPKVQSAFLEAMAERQVTVDNTTHELEEPFFVLGTQNPIDTAGTFALPVVQLDRFIFKIPMSYVNKSTEIEILSEERVILDNLKTIKPVCSKEDLLCAQRGTQDVKVSDSLRAAIVDICQATRDSGSFVAGASTRAALMLQQACRALAILSDRDFATEDDLKEALPLVLAHRIKPIGGVDVKSLLNELAKPVIEKLTVLR